MPTHGRPAMTFQLAATRRRLAARRLGWLRSRVFQLAATRRRLGDVEMTTRSGDGFNSQPREGGWAERLDQKDYEDVSTRSHAKAAGRLPCVRCDTVDVSTRSHAKAAGLGLLLCCLL